MPKNPSFTTRLTNSVRSSGSIACVGIDPRLEWLPRDLVEDTDPATALERYGCAVVEAVTNRAAAVKLNCAFFERHGSAGWQAMEAIARHARDHHLPVIADAKRGDIGSSAQAYADAFVGQASVFDAVTVSPWLGDDGIRPFIDTAARHGRGVFVVVRSSNPSSEMLQETPASATGVHPWERLAGHLAQLADDLGAQTQDQPGTPESLGPLGAVIGATRPEAIGRARKLMPRAWLLLPGYGAQGGKAEAVRDALDADGLGALVNASRSIGFPWRSQGLDQPASTSTWQDQVTAAMDLMNADLHAALNNG